MEGTNAVDGITWDYGKDRVTVRFDPAKTSPAELSRVIEKLGYTAEVVAGATLTPQEGKQPKKFHVPEHAPKFFRNAVAEARRAKKPIVLDFWATWCAPCLRLKKETLHDVGVAELVAKVQLILVDLDQYPKLGEAFEVVAVPDLLFIDRSGVIVDRLRSFEPPKPFAQRLRKLLHE